MKVLTAEYEDRLLTTDVECEVVVIPGQLCCPRVELVIRVARSLAVPAGFIIDSQMYRRVSQMYRRVSSDWPAASSISNGTPINVMILTHELTP